MKLCIEVDHIIVFLIELFAHRSHLPAFELDRQRSAARVSALNIVGDDLDRTDRAEPQIAEPPWFCSAHSPDERWSIVTPGPSVRTAANRDLHQRIMPQPVEECDASEQRRVWRL